MIPQQHARVRPPPFDAKTDSRERVPSLKCYEQNISRAKTIGVRARKESLPYAGWIKNSEVSFVDFRDGIWEAVAG